MFANLLIALWCKRTVLRTVPTVRYASWLKAAQSHGDMPHNMGGGPGPWHVHTPTEVSKTQ